eukprot:s2333_g2.t1
MVVKGGRRHSEHLVVQHGETLQVGFVHVSVLVPDFDSDSSLGGSDDAEEESEEEEEDPTSNASTRSRSLRRGMSPTKPEPSSDHSYEPGPSHDNLRKQHDTAFFHAWSIPDVVSDTLCDGQPWALFEDLPNLVSTAQACKGLSYVGCMIDHRVPDVGPGPNTHLGGHGRDGRGWQELGLPPEDGGLQGTDPPEFQIPRPQAGQGQLQPVTDTAATFLIYAFEYAPEVLRVRLQFPAGIEHVTHVLQQAREELAARRQPCLVPVHPQPAADYGIFLATPAWTRDVYVLYDLTRLNGTIFSAHISPAVDRASILSVADVDSHLDVQVFVHDLPRPLQQHEVVRVSTGYCISIVPRQHPPFAVASLADMLLSSAGWNAQIVLPLAPDRWLHVLTDTEPCRFRLDPARRLYLRNDLADMLAYEVEDLTVQPAQPRILDHLDYGVRAHSVVVATQLLARRAEASEIRTIFLLDMRPITAGLAWGVANHGRVRAESLVARFDSQCPAGYRSQITGGRPLHTDEGLYFEANVPSLRSEAYPGPTLLEQSVSLPENTAFFEARILLDTLVEHFGWEPSPFPGPCEDSRGGHSHQAPLGCKQLRLSEHLPARQYDLTQCELCLGRTLDEAVEIASCPWDLARSLPDSIRVHPATAEQLATSAALTGYPENSFVLFTDGSFNGSVSSWVCGSLVSAWHRNHSAIEAERSAIFWALVWALRAPRGYSVFLQGDNLAALGQAAGTCGGP